MIGGQISWDGTTVVNIVDINEDCNQAKLFMDWLASSPKVEKHGCSAVSVSPTINHREKCHVQCMLRSLV